MLVLSRKVSEVIMLGDDIKVTVEKIEGNRVRISVDAPKEVPIVRGEVKRKEGGTNGVTKPN